MPIKTRKRGMKFTRTNVIVECYDGKILQFSTEIKLPKFRYGCDTRSELLMLHCRLATDLGHMHERTKTDPAFAIVSDVKTQFNHEKDIEGYSVTEYWEFDT